MNTKHYLTAILVLVAVLLTACAPSQYVIYSVNNITTSGTLEVIPINVSIKILTDNRANIKENEILFTNSQSIIIDRKRYCINSEKYYNKAVVVNQITQLLVEHFKKAKVFTNVSYHEDLDNDYYLTGTLSNFYGEQDYPEAAGAVMATGMMFGAIGGAIAAAATSGAKTPGKIIIEITDIKLFRKDGALVKDFGDFYKEYEGDFPANTSCWCIYQNVNEKLRDFNTQLIEKIRYELLGVKL